jgi:hypothetical protein
MAEDQNASWPHHGRLDGIGAEAPGIRKQPAA